MNSVLAHQAIRRVKWRERLLDVTRPLLSFPKNKSLVENWKNGNLILLYHQIIDPSVNTSNPFCVTRTNFEKQIEWLAKSYDIITAIDLTRRLADNAPRQGCAVITFDDGHASIFTHVQPILKAYGIPATIFIDTGSIGKPSALSPAQIKSLAKNGFEIGSHSVSHANLATLPDEKITTEVVSSRELLADLIGKKIHGIAYPFGKYNDRVVRLVKEAGYEYGCTCRQDQTNYFGDNPYELSRLEITLFDTEKRFKRKLDGYYASVFANWYRLGMGIK